MRRILSFLAILLLPVLAWAQIPGGSDIQIGNTPVVGGTNGQCLYVNGSVVGNQACSTGSVSTFSAGSTGFTPNSATAGAVTLAGILGVANGGTGVTLAGTGGTSQVLKQTSVGGTVTVARLACSDLSDSGSGCSGAGGLTIGTTTITSGTNTRILYDNSGVVGEYTLTGTGTVVAMQAGPTFTGTLSSANQTITSSSNSSLIIGPNGTTNPVLKIDSSTGSQAAGLQIKGAVTGGSVAISAIDSGSNTNLTIDGKGSGTITLGNSSSGAITLGRATTISAALTYGGVALSNAVTGTGNMVLSAAPTLTGTLNTADHVITSASATSLAVGRLGSTSPAFAVDSSTGTQVAGFKITGAATGGTVALVATDSGSNTNLTVNAKGSGTIGLGTTSTGTVTIAATATPTTIPSTTITIAGVTTGTNADTLCLSAGGVILIQAASCTISSARFKTNIKPLRVSGLRIIEGLHPVSFKMREGERANPDPNFGRPQIGLTAENVAEVDTRLALYEDDLETPKSYRQESLIAVLVKAVQELKADNDNIRAEMKRVAR